MKLLKVQAIFLCSYLLWKHNIDILYIDRKCEHVFQMSLCLISRSVFGMRSGLCAVYLDSDTDFIILTVYAATVHLKWN